METTRVNARVKKHRDALRMAGLRPVQIWVPDTRRPDFAEECRRQCLLAAQPTHPCNSSWMKLWPMWMAG